MTRASIDNATATWDATSSPWGSTITYKFLTSLPSDYLNTPSGKFKSDGQPYVYSTSDFDSWNPLEQQWLLSGMSAISGFANITFTPGDENSIIRIGAIKTTVFRSDTAIPPPIAGYGTVPGNHSDPRQGDLWLAPPDGRIIDSGYSFARKTITHEFGHTLGLTHNSDGGISGLPAKEQNDKYSIMAYASHPAERIGSEAQAADEFQIYDISALQAKYGAKHDINNDTYKDFDLTNIDAGNVTVSLGDRITSIWDGGGIDKITAEFSSGSSYIDLRPGFFSSIGTYAFSNNSSSINNNWTVTKGSGGTIGTENVSIAFGAYIENAAGGSENDVLVGNMLDNVLTGGGGNDIIFGDGLAIAEADTFLTTVLHKPATGISTEVYGEGQDADYRRIDLGGVQGPGVEAAAFSADRTKQKDTIEGGDGDDLLVGGWGDDTLRGGDGNDVLIGSKGIDALRGGAGEDSVFGGDGNDRFYADMDGANDKYVGGDGVDTIAYQYAHGDGVVQLTTTPEGLGLVNITGAQGENGETSFGSDTIDSIELIAVEAGDGRDVFGIDERADLTSYEYLNAGQQPSGTYDTLLLESGNADGSLTPWAKAATIDLSNNILSTQNYVLGIPYQTVSLNIYGFEAAKGGNGDDTLIGANEGQSILDGGGGNDLIKVSGPAAVIHFGVGGGKDLVETGAGDYQLLLDNLNPEDITFIAGGTDMYGTDPRTKEFGPFLDLNMLTIKINSSGEMITFVAKSVHDNPFDGYLARDSVRMKYREIEEDSLANSPLDSIKFSDGTVWSASTIWDHLNHNLEDGVRVAFDLMKPFNAAANIFPGKTSSDLATTLMARNAAMMDSTAWSTTSGALGTISSDPVSFINYLNEQYFGRDPLPGPAGQQVSGTVGDDSLIDGYGNDNLAGGAGNDTYALSYGDDTIAWNEGDGDDVALGAGAFGGNDTLVLGDGIAPSDLQFAVTPSGTGLIISFANKDGSVTLSKEVAAFADRGAFSIAFHDGTTWTHEDLLSAASNVIANAHQDIQGTSSANFLSLPQTNFTVTGHAGDDFLSVSGDGSGTIKFAKGDGHDELSNYGGDAFRNDTLSLTDILADEIALTRNGNALVITVTATGDTFTVDDQFTETTPDVNLGINRIVFADNTVWTRSEIPTTGSDTIVGTDGIDVLHGRGGDDQVSGLGGSDSLFGDDGNDTLIGGAGNDALNGGNGNDTYAFAPGDGQDIICDVRGTGITNVVQFGSGVAPGDVYVYTANAGTDIVLGRIDSTDTVTISAMNGDTTKGVDEVHFADGTVWSYAEIMARRTSFTAGNDTITGTSGNQTLYGAAGDDLMQGLAGDDVLDGGIGNDTLYGGDGNDVYRFAPGDGQDLVADFPSGSGTGGIDTIQLGAGILPANVSVTQANNGADLVLNFAGSNDQITLSNAINSSLWRIEQVTFADGTNWSYSDLMAKATTPTSGNDIIYGDESNQTLSGGAGDDKLYGARGDDTLIGGTGNDYLNGGPGSDTYVFAQGDGNDTIDDSRNVSWTNTLQLGAGMTRQNTFITTSANGLDVVIGFVDSSDTISIKYMNVTTGNGIDQIKFADGSSWSYADIMARRMSYTAGNDTITGTSGNDTLYGGGGNDALSGLEGNDSLAGGAGDDTLTGGAGNDVLNGGTGSDTAVFAGLRNDYQLITSGGSLSIADLQSTVSGDDGTDQLIGVETAQFSDQSVSLASPVILDLDGNSVTLASKTAGARFDWNGDGVADRTGWTSGGDGFLALDRDGDGKISGANELSFVNDKPGARSDLDGLSAFDTDHDGRLSASDDQFAKFGVWVDANGNGIADAGEFKTLGDAGIASIGLGGTPTERNWGWDDNLVLNSGSFQRADGSNGALADVALNYDASHRNIGSDSGSTGGKRGWRWRQFDRPGAVAPIRSLLDGDLGEIMPAWSNRQAALLAEHIAAFAPAGADVFNGVGDRDTADGLALTMVRPDTPVSRFTAL